MPWYGYSLLAMFISVWTPIFQKWALNHKINRTKLLFYIFVGLMALYLGIALISAPSGLAQAMQNRTFWLWGMLVGAFSLAGNMAMTKAFAHSPNPGYVQAVVVTNILLVLLLSVVFLAAPIKLSQTIGTITVVVGLIILFLGSKSAEKSGRWQTPAVLAAVSFGLMFLVVKKMTTIGFTPSQVLVILFFWASMGFGILSRFQHVGLRWGILPRIVIVPIILYILVGFFANLLNFTAIARVDNPGYSTAIWNSSVILTLLASHLVFPKESGGEFNWQKWLGTIIALAGVIIIILG